MQLFTETNKPDKKVYVDIDTSNENHLIIKDEGEGI